MAPGFVTLVFPSIFKDVRDRNIFLLGLAFMVFYTGFLPTNYIAPIVVKSVEAEDASFTGDGYTSLAIVYAVFACANWFAPSIVYVIGSKYSVIAGFCLVCSYIIVFFNLSTWSLYFSSVLVGIGAACIWTGQGALVTVNSTPETISRNSGIFWSMFECSLLFGNLIVYSGFRGLVRIDQHARTVIFAEFLGIALAGILLLCFLKPTSSSRIPSDDRTTAADAFLNAGRLFFTKDMMILSLTFIHTGLELSFFSAVYGTCVGFTRRFGSEAKELVGLNGIFVGVGEITGSFIFGVLGNWTLRRGRDVAFLFGYVVHTVAFYVIFLNLPADSPLGETDEVSFVPANGIVAMICSFLLGFGDGCYNPQIISLLGSLYSDNSAPAFALYKFVQSLASASSLFSSTYLPLTIQLLILVFSSTFGLAAFCWVEWRYAVAQLQLQQSTISSHQQRSQNGRDSCIL